MAEDREFALLLHNQDFLEQMQSNQEFMRTLNQDERVALSSSNVGKLAKMPKFLFIDSCMKTRLLFQK